MLGTAAGVITAGKVRRRVQLCRAKQPGLVGHARMAKRAARLVPPYAFQEEQFFATDDAPPEIAGRRRRGFEQLSVLHRERFAKNGSLYGGDR
jgi:glutamate-1-semialdehyde 2,1-aminomutase